MTDTSQATNGSAHLDRIELQLTVTDPEVLAELNSYPAGEERDLFAQTALRIGVLALRQASGLLDGDVVRREGERLLFSVRELLTSHTSHTIKDVSASLRKYFDPADGELPQRLNRLISKDGELEQLLSRHVGGDASTLTSTLEKHVGEESALLKTLSPDHSKGVLALLKQLVETSLAEQKKTILGQFSLDDKESALSRLVSELTDKNGRLRQELGKDVETVRKEFSLDNEEGALFRLVARVEAANQTIMDEFSHDNEESAIKKLSTMLEATHKSIHTSLTLDDEKSPLARIRTELRKQIDGMAQSNQRFQSEVRESLGELKAKREAAGGTTTHGLEFEDALGEFLRHEAQRLNDIFHDTKSTAGSLSRCKVGDHVLELGAETAAPGARIAFEAKGNKAYDISKALAELKKARENREAQVGILVFTPAAAPEDLEPINRYGDDLIIVWDPEKAETDVFLRTAISLARAMVVADRRLKESNEADVAEMEAATREILRNLKTLGEIYTLASTVKNNGEKIMKKSTKLQEHIEEEVERIQKHLVATPSV